MLMKWVATSQLHGYMASQLHGYTVPTSQLHGYTVQLSYKAMSVHVTCTRNKELKIQRYSP